MRLKKLTPTTREYNLLLRAVRDCGLGDDEFAAQLLEKTTRSSRKSNEEKMKESRKILSEVEFTR